MSVKTENHWGMLKDIWKIMWPAALPLYLSYFYYRFVGVYTSGLLGQIMDLLLYRNGNLADSRLFLKLALAFLFSLLLMPSVDFLTNIVIFRKGLRYEASVVDRIFRKDYEAFGSCQSAEWAARVSSDPLTYRNMAILAPVRLLADGTVFLTALYASLRRDARLALLLTAGIWLSIALRFYDNIRKLRQLKHLSQEALGELLGVSGQAVSKWEQAITSPDISLLPALAGVFGVTIDSLFQDAIARRYPGYGLLYHVRSRRDSQMALRYYRLAIAEGDRSSLFWMSAHQQLTKLLDELGRLEEAVEEQKKWRDAQPDCAWARVAYAYALERAGRLEEACAEAKEALRLDAEDINVLTMAGDLFSQTGECEKALSCWDRAYANDSTQISCLFSKAELYASMGRTEDAIGQYEEILAWLEAHGYNMELEGAHPRRRIQELRGEGCVPHSVQEIFPPIQAI